MRFIKLKKRITVLAVRAYCMAGFIRHAARNKDKHVLFFPEFPGGTWYVAPKFLRYCGVHFSAFMRARTWESSGPLLRRLLLRGDQGVKARGISYIIFSFEDNTRSQVDPEAYIRSRDRFPANTYLLNHRCTDIAKSRVDAVHHEVFGYALGVDPLVFTGEMVEKSDMNGRHDGCVVQGPLTPAQVSPGHVYQRLINNETSGQVDDHRVALFGDTIALVYLKKRPVQSRFSNTNTTAMILSPSAAFSEDEQVLIRRFACAMGLDIGELDILRDRDNNRIYVVDVNKTVSGPPNHLGIRDTLRAIGLLGRSFQTAILDPLERYRV